MPFIIEFAVIELASAPDGLRGRASSSHSGSEPAVDPLLLLELPEAFRHDIYVAAWFLRPPADGDALDGLGVSDPAYPLLSRALDSASLVP